MKTLLSTIAALALAATTAGQCPTFIGQQPVSLPNLAEVVTRYTGLALVKKEAPYGSKVESYSDTAVNLSGYSVACTTTKQYKDGAVIESEPTVQRVQMWGPEEQMRRMLNEYWRPMLANCNAKESATWIQWGSEMLVWYTDRRQGVPVLVLFIKKY